MKACKRILVPTDGTRLSLSAARRAAALARDLKAEITAVYVMPTWTPPVVFDVVGVPAEVFDERAFNAASEETARIALGKVKAAAALAKVKCNGVAVTDNHPWQGIVKTAKSKRCDMIVMASHGKSGVEAALLGSETRNVLAHTAKPVLVCR